ncbi:hypothetical protein DPMN_014068 [Dreissena polymorpha]|uniref:Uncharacterized protein n=1 Tax=Dreissena polymorpha TaxID=45954 RepID=A0A9D4N8I0_DREPO|nr:hypothetical protein DPMN_014068 [Dreissena polymorpha]
MAFCEVLLLITMDGCPRGTFTISWLAINCLCQLKLKLVMLQWSSFMLLYVQDVGICDCKVDHVKQQLQPPSFCFPQEAVVFPELVRTVHSSIVLVVVKNTPVSPLWSVFVVTTIV